MKWEYSIVFQLSDNQYLIVWKQERSVNWEVNEEFYCHELTEKNPIHI